MSLDVYSRGKPEVVQCICPNCDHVHEAVHYDCYFTSNITHNLATMAKEVGIYMHMWRPEDLGITKAQQLIEPLRVGVALLESDPDRFKALNSPNGWGVYETLVEFAKEYLASCVQYPEASVYVSR